MISNLAHSTAKMKMILLKNLYLVILSLILILFVLFFVEPLPLNNSEIITAIGILFAIEIGVLQLRQSMPKNEFEEHINNLAGPDSDNGSGTEFWHKNRITSIVGRKDELDALEGFCMDDKPLLWWAVTGRGGTGKSRLALEFMLSYNDKRKRKDKYTMKYLDNTFFQSNFEERCVSYSPWEYPGNLFLVLDNVTQYREKVGNWLLQLKNPPNKIRILILEREDVESSDDEFTSVPPWYEDIDRGFEGEQNVDDYMFRSRNFTRFLNIDNIAKADLCQIAKEYIEKKVEKEEYIEKYGKKDRKEVEKLIEKSKKIPTYLKSMDNDLQRPLYVLFVARAICEVKEKEDVFQWNEDKLLTWVVEQEDNKIRKLFGPSTESCYKLIAFANAVGKISFDELPPLLGNELEKIKEKKYWKKLNAIDGYNGNKESIRKMMPDILAEFHFLYHINRIRGRDGNKYLNSFIDCATEDIRYYEFLDRVIKDFPENEYLCSEYLMRDPKSDRLDIWSEFLFILLKSANTQDFKQWAEAIERVENIGNKKDTPEMWLLIATILSILSWSPRFSMEREKCAVIVEKLENIAEKQNKQEIWEMFAKGLVNLMKTQGRDQCTDTVQKLENIAEKQNTPEIWEIFAEGLVYLISQQDLDQCTDTVQKLENIAEKQNTPKIWGYFVRGLVNLLRKQDRGQYTDTMQKLLNIAEKQNAPEIWKIFARGLVNLTLVNLTFHQDLDQHTDTVQKLQNIAEKLNTPEIWNYFVRGLVDLANKQDLDQCIDTIQKLQDIAEKQNTQEIWNYFVRGLVDLANKQDLDQCIDTIQKLQDIAEKQNTPEIWIIFAEGLVNLANKQDLNQCTDTIKKVEEIAKKQNTPEIWIIFAEGLVNLTNKQDLNQYTDTIKKVEEIAKIWNERKIWIIFAKGVANLAQKQDLDQFTETIKKLEELVDNFENDFDKLMKNLIWSNFLLRFVDLAQKQDLEQRGETVKKLQEITRRVEKITEIGNVKEIVNLTLQEIQEIS